MRIHCLQHVPFEGLANIESWAGSRGHQITKTLYYENGQLPALGTFDWLIIMGGPMGTYEEAEYPWLIEEKRFIAEAISSGKLVLGICLGAQLIASALGAEVFPGPHKEIGWFPVQLTSEAAESLLSELPATFMPLHWHGDTFDLPPGARLLATSEAYRHQAFQFAERVLALQFHLELSSEDVRYVNQCSGGEAPPARFVQPEAEIVAAAKNFAANARWLDLVLARLEQLHHPA